MFTIRMNARGLNVPRGRALNLNSMLEISPPSTFFGLVV